MVVSRFSIVVASVLLSWSANAVGACPTGHARNCVDFGMIPQITNQIVAAEKLPPAPDKSPLAETAKSYSGPTVGLSNKVRRAPTGGYRWALD